jgi:hypothetical protein
MPLVDPHFQTPAQRAFAEGLIDLDEIEESARNGLFNGPEGCETILRLIAIIRPERTASIAEWFKGSVADG